MTVVDEDEIPGFSWEPLETAQDVQETPTTDDLRGDRRLNQLTFGAPAGIGGGPF